MTHRNVLVFTWHDMILAHEFHSFVQSEISQQAVDLNTVLAVSPSAGAVSPVQVSRSCIASTGQPELDRQYRSAGAVSPVQFSRSCIASTGQPELYHQYRSAEAVSPVQVNRSFIASTGQPELYRQYRSAGAGSPVHVSRSCIAGTGQPELYRQYRSAGAASPVHERACPATHAGPANQMETRPIIRDQAEWRPELAERGEGGGCNDGRLWEGGSEGEREESGLTGRDLYHPSHPPLSFVRTLTVSRGPRDPPKPPPLTQRVHSVQDPPLAPSGIISACGSVERNTGPLVTRNKSGCSQSLIQHTWIQSGLCSIAYLLSDYVRQPIAELKQFIGP